MEEKRGEQDVWNVADGYVKLKILKPMVLLDKYDFIAQFGYEDIDMAGQLDLPTIKRNRIEALLRFHATLSQMFNNSSFSIKNKDRIQFESFRERLNKVGDVIDGISSVSWNDILKEENVEINEKHFRNCLRVLQEIKEIINLPITHAGLIFRNTDEMDLDAMVREMVEGG